MTKRSAAERDEVCIGRARRRLLRAYRRLGTVRKVGAELGINHGWVSALVKHGSVPKGEALRLKLGVPTVLPSEREARKQAKMETWTVEQYKAWMEKGGQKSKWKNVRTEVDGIVFHSGKEAMRYGELKMLERAGEISELELQVTFRLVVKGVHVCNYVADFVYIKGNAIERVVEDVKGKRTREYVMKKKLMAACYGIEIVET